ncbi:helix-turn-helix domain-containing protein [Streptomyces sp. NPDC085479]|uniref:helix-turn-helix domain-containing protein n=1 Tax=Streptomyces sp. NPDC085479 TaxID=3365726 RepID=UPI0037D04988
MSGTEECLRLTVAALMARTGERQNDLAAAIGLSQAQVSRKQSGAAHWSLDDVDLLAAHYGLSALDLLAGPAHAAGVLHGATLPLAPDAPAPAGAPATGSAPSAPSAHLATVPAPAGAPGVTLGPCVLCGGPATDEVDGFPQHLSAEECAATARAVPAVPAVATRDIEDIVRGAPSTAAPEPEAHEPDATESEAHEPEPDAHEPEVPDPAPATAPAAEPEAAVEPEAPPAPPAAGVSRPPRTTAGYASGTLVEQITGRVHDVLAEHAGDVETAQAALIKAAIPDVMALFKVSRASGRYEHSDFPPTADILRKKSQKGADEIWEGRPKWRNAEVFKAAKQGARFEVTALDMNAAYLSALKCWLPIGQLRETTGGVHDPKKSGVHLITPADWHHADLPNPLGHRMEPGELWVTESTLRQLLDCARAGLADAPVIHRSLVSGATEVLLEKLRRALAEVRRTALAEGDTLTVEYVKAMYAKFVSTIGESSANREIRRPDWMHIIRAKAFANLWMKADKARTAGLTVVEMSGTDELHVIGDWHTVFAEGRDLHEVKAKKTYTLGGA